MYNILKYTEFINETHYTDLFHKVFLDFIKKYKNVKGDNYYVQFTNFKGDILDRSAYNDPNHSDPMGNYAYPLKYVLKYPADVWYGYNASNIRILEINRSKSNILKFNNMDVSHFNYYCQKFGFKQKSEYLEKYENRIEPKNSGFYGRWLLQMIQTDLNEYVRSGEEQTKLILKAGYNVLLDESKSNNTAVINAREPEQIVFLDRKSFKVVEIFKTQSNNTKIDNAPSNQNKIMRTLCQKIFNDVFEDKIKETKGSSYYSVKGREINIIMTFHDSHTWGKKIGEKKHKESKTSNHYYFDLDIFTEKGVVSYKSNTDSTIEEVVDIVKYKWVLIKDKPVIEDWIPRSIKQTQLEYDIEQEKKRKEKAKEEYAYYKKNEQRFRDTLIKWVNELNHKFEIPEVNSDELYLMYNIFEKVSNITRHGGISRALSTYDKYLHEDKYLTALYDNKNAELIREILYFYKDILIYLSKKDDIFFTANFYNIL